MFLDRVKAATATTGTGTVALGAAVVPYQAWAAAGAVDGSTYSYLIEDGTAWEIGRGVYAAGADTLTRPGPGADTSFASSTGALLALSGTATIANAVNANDLDEPASSSALVKLGEVIVTSAQATIDFPSIPAGYRALQIKGFVRSDNPVTRDDCCMTFNGDTGNNYSRNLMTLANGAAAFTWDATRANVPLCWAPAGNAGGGFVGTFQWEIEGYDSTVAFKSFGGLLQSPANVGDMYGGSCQGAWFNEAPVTDITFHWSTGGNFVPGCKISLYGVV